MQPSKKLYLRLYLPYSATVVIATVLAWWIAVSVLTDSLERRLESQLGHATEVLVSGNLPLTPDLLSRLEALLRAQIFLIQANGQVEPRSTLPAASLEEALNRVAHTPGQIPTSVPLKLEGTPYLAVVRSGAIGGGERYRGIAAVTSLADVRAAARNTAWWLGAAALAGIVLLSWVGHRIARSITDPIQQLARMSEQIAEGDRSVRVHIPADTEIGALAGSLNRMAEHLQAYEEEAAARNRLAALGEMAARIAHEIRNPLTAIKLQIQLLGEGPGGGDKSRVSRILDEINRLELIVSGTLTMARPQQLQPQTLDLAQQVQAVCDLFTPQLAHRHISLETALDPTIQANLDSDRFKQVVFNLLTNAADVLPDGGRIHVSTRYEPAGQQALLSIEDSGPGIPAAQRQAIFAGATSGNANRLGIGLKLSRELVELHGGSISADDSETLGGARFTVRLPATNMQQ